MFIFKSQNLKEEINSINEEIRLDLKTLKSFSLRLPPLSTIAFFRLEHSSVLRLRQLY